MLIAQLSDTHISLRDKKAWTADEAEARLAEAVAQVNEFRPAVDAVMVTGDLVDDGTAPEYQRLRRVLDGLTAPYFVLPGNHDTRPALRAAFGDHGYLPAEGPFLHYVLEDLPLRLIALDTHVPRAAHGEICPERLAWLAARLHEAPDRPTAIFMHHPPFATGIALMDRLGCYGADALAELIVRNPQVERVACGHVHRAIQTRWAGTAACIAPSTVGQVELTLPDGPDPAYIHEPRGFLLHYWNPEAGLTTHVVPVGDYERVPVRL